MTTRNGVSLLHHLRAEWYILTAVLLQMKVERANEKRDAHEQRPYVPSAFLISGAHYG